MSSDVQQSVQQTQRLIELKVDDVSPDFVVVGFTTIDGNDPNTYGNKLYLWQASAVEIPVGHTAKNTSSIETHEPQGTHAFGELELQALSYLVGYGVGPSGGSKPNLFENVAAIIQIPAGATTASQFTTVVTEVTVTAAEPDVLACSFTTPPGALPSTNGDWIGVWQTAAPADLYYAPPKHFQPVKGDSEKGDITFEITLLRGTDYTVGYFKGGYDTTKTTEPNQKTLAAATTFRT
jgi:hypothetical protein